MLNCPIVIETIISPAFLNKFHSSCNQTQSKALSALGKLGILASRNETIPLVKDLLLNTNLNKNLICGVLRSFGDKGLRTFLDILGMISEPIEGTKREGYSTFRYSVKKKSKKLKISDPKILSLIAYNLGFNVDNNYKGNFKIKILSEEDEEKEKVEIKRGEICEYLGCIQPPVFELKDDFEGKELNEEEIYNQRNSTSAATFDKFERDLLKIYDNGEKGLIFVNSEDLVIVLKRLLKLRTNHVDLSKPPDFEILENWVNSLQKDEDFPVLTQVILKNDRLFNEDKNIMANERIRFTVLALSKLLQSKRKKLFKIYLKIYFYLA